jgi:hypothetical protein
MQFALSAATELDFAFEEEIEPARETAPGLARALGDGLQLSVLLSQPRDDEARLGELYFAEQDGSGGVQVRIEC